MVCPQFSLDEFKEEIISRYYRGEQYSKIAPDYKVSRRTLERRIQAWGIQKRIAKRKSSSDPLGNPDVRIFIGICWDRNLTDKEIQYILNNNGWILNTRTISNIRKDIGILQRVSAFQRQEGVSVTAPMPQDILCYVMDPSESRDPRGIQRDPTKTLALYKQRTFPRSHTLTVCSTLQYKYSLYL
jgi:transposase